VKQFSFLALTVVLAACGTTVDRTEGPAASSASGSGVAETDAARTPEPAEDPALKPPGIVLRSAVGDQKAVEGSYCIDYVDPGSGQGSGVCGDSAQIFPRTVTVLQPGDEVAFVFSRANIVRPSGCHGESKQDCIGYVYVRPLGCADREVERAPLALGPQTRWTVDLPTGGYQLDVFGYFEADSGASGDVSGTLGLYVGGGPKEYDALGVTAVKPAMQVCPYPL
jgi:hypothetical protein